MALQYDVENKSAVIAAAGTLSAAVSLGAKVVIGFSLPAVWTAAVITFQVSSDGTTWQELYDAAGNEIQIALASTAAGAYVYVDPAFWRGINMIKIRSGTAASPVAQSVSATINVVIRSEI